MKVRFVFLIQTHSEVPVASGSDILPQVTLLLSVYMLNTSRCDPALSCPTLLCPSILSTMRGSLRMFTVDFAS